MNKIKDKNARSHIYGPVPSRRLGYSLGVDILPLKTCTLDCIYCQLGPTPRKTVQRKKHFEQAKILAQIREALDSGKHIDYITFSGSGEPTLNTALGQIIREIKKMTATHVAVLTNATLLADSRVRKALHEADLVVPSLDAATQELFTRINRPHPSIRFDDVIQGLKAFRKEFSGRIWLEIMLVKDINDSPGHIQKLKRIIGQLRPDKIQLNSVVRPPAEDAAQPLTSDGLTAIRKVLGERCEIIADFTKQKQRPLETGLERAILATVQRRPVTLSDMSAFLGKHPDEILKHLNPLLQKKRIKKVRHKGNVYYESAEAT